MKITKLQQLFLASAIVTGASSALAQSNISYNYAGIQYFDQEIDDFDCDQDGLGVHGSVELNSDFFARGSFSDVGGDSCGARTLSLGLGYQTLFGADSSIYGSLSFEDISPDYGDNDDTGLIAAAGLRGFFNPNLEGKIEVAHHTAYDGNTVLNGGVAYWFNQQFAVTGDVSLGSEVSGAAVGLRMNF